jgi:predicted PurR-regulated permease PerM
MGKTEKRRTRSPGLAKDPGAASGTPHPVIPRTVTETVILITAVFLLAGLSYAVHSILSPFVIIAGLIYLLYPLREAPLPRRLMWLAVVLFAIWFFYSIRVILTPFILAFILAYIINPFVTYLEGRGVPRGLSSFIAVLLFVGVVVTVTLFIMPVAFDQFQEILMGVRAIATEAATLLNSGEVFELLAAFGMPVETMQELIRQQLTPGLTQVLKSLFEGVFGVVSSISSLAMHVINVVIIPFLVFYILKDFRLILDRFWTLFPDRQRERVIHLGLVVDGLMGRYFRGMVVVAVIQGTIATIGLWVIGVRYPLVLGIMTGLLTLIPYVGLIVSLVVSALVALFSGQPAIAKVIGVIVLYLSQKIVQASILEPKIIGGQVGLHPVLLIFCLLVFGYFLGFIGMLIAVPATALMIAGYDEWRSWVESGQIRQHG